MRVTPLDIIQKEFHSTRKGYDADQVRVFLDEIRASMEDLLKENQRLRGEISQRDAEIAELREKEADIKETLLLARRLSEDMERSARRESDVIVGEARIEAERILMAARDERGGLQAEIMRLQTTRTIIMTELRTVLDAHTRMLDQMDSDKEK